MASPYATSQNYATQSSSPSYKPSSVNLQAMNLNSGVGSGNSLGAGGGGVGGGGGGGSSTGNYSANSSNYSNNYDSNNYTQNTSSYDTSYENITRKSIDDQLLTKVSQLLAQKEREFNSTNNIILNQMQSSRELTRSCRDMTNDKEEFY